MRAVGLLEDAAKMYEYVVQECLGVNLWVGVLGVGMCWEQAYVAVWTIG
jgi:hypothetical protein